MKRFERIYVEISNICNLQCSFCPEVLRPKKMMAPALFAKILAEVKPYAEAITFHVMGEPLAHPQFLELLTIATETEIPVILTTNGLLLERQAALLLNAPVIKQINFSIHSFFDNFPHRDIQPYLSKLTAFSTEFVQKNPGAFVNYRLWNLADVDKVSTPNNDMIYATLKTLFENPELPTQINVIRQKSFRLDRHIKLHFDTRFEWPSLNSLTPNSDGTCHGLKNQIAILTDGTVVPCCLDKEGVIRLGTLTETPLHTILNSERAKNLLAGFAQNKALEPLCQKCQYKTRFHRPNAALI